MLFPAIFMLLIAGLNLIGLASSPGSFAWMTWWGPSEPKEALETAESSSSSSMSLKNFSTLWPEALKHETSTQRASAGEIAMFWGPSSCSIWGSKFQVQLLMTRSFFISPSATL